MRFMRSDYAYSREKACKITAFFLIDQIFLYFFYKKVHFSSDTV